MMEQKSREIRVFISSTFRDMQAEREELVKRIFPKLRKLCEERQVTWNEVDLRWGIPEEQNPDENEKKVLTTCLQEIKNCRPYFIGLLGERYGWIPDQISTELIEEEPWLEEHSNHSVTELEILHGVLNDPEMAGHSFFYFREPSYIQTLPPETRKEFCEEPLTEEIKKYGEEEAKKRAESRTKKLVLLKERIRNSDFPVKENYLNPKELGELVLKDMTGRINELYPEGSQPDPLDKEALDHEIFAQSRSGVYIGRKEYFDVLDGYVNSDKQPLVIVGESGAGKSALLSKWALEYKKNHPENLLIMHFIGATPYSSEWVSMLRRIMREFKRHFNIQQEIPDNPEQLRSAFANWLNMASAKGKAVIIMDALNQLEDSAGARELAWLPPVIPENIRIVFSSLPGRSLDELIKRNCQVLEIQAFQSDERKQFITEYLGQYRKDLPEKTKECISAAAQTYKPLYLRALIEELRQFGQHEELDNKIDYYLQAQNPEELYGKILSRYEEDYERERPGLVKDSMSLLWAARRGLSEAELMDLLGSGQNPLARLIWSPLFLSVRESLVNRSGLLNFFHDFLRKAVEDKYLSTPELKQKAHVCLADYFEKQELTTRKTDELPWQLSEAHAWEDLFYLFSDLSFFTSAWKSNQYEVKAYWSQLEKKSFSMEEAYKSVITDPEKVTDKNWVLEISFLLGDTGYLKEAFSLRQFLVEYYRESGDKGNLQASLGNQAAILFGWGKLDEAMELYQEQESICREFKIKDSLSNSFGNQALILAEWGKLDEAMKLYQEQERICRELLNKGSLTKSLGNQALILAEWGKLDEAMKLLKKQERICRELGNEDSLSSSLGNQAIILAKGGELAEAMKLFKEVERIFRELGNKDGLQASLGNHANILYGWGKLDEAMKLYQEQERICRELENKYCLAKSLGNQAGICNDWGKPDEAMKLVKEEERICWELRSPSGLALTFIHQATVLIEMGQPQRALSLAEEAYKLATEHNLISLASQIKPLLNKIRTQLK